MQYLIDASVYVFRAWYSMPADLVDGDGNPVNAFYGYCRFLGDFIEKMRPVRAAVLFDESLTTSFRSRLYPGYKANREQAPEELKRQFQLCRRYTRALGVMEGAHPTFEADDLIGTLVMEGRTSGTPSTIVSRDKDLAQLVGPKDVFWDFAGKGRLTYEEIPGVFGVHPEQIADFLALAGDSVDNIPGVPGVGRKTAAALLSHFGTLEVVYANLDRVCHVDCRGAKTLGLKLEQHRDAAMLARELTRIACDADFERPATGVAVHSPDLGAVNALCDEVGFGIALRRQAERIVDVAGTGAAFAPELAPA